MNVLVTGATGFLGFNIAKALVKAGHSVVACARNPDEWRTKLPMFTWQEVDFSKDVTSAAWLPRLTNVDLVINAVGIIAESGEQTFKRIQTDAPCALFAAANELNLKVIQISAIGADQPNQMPPFLETKKHADHFLQALPVDSVIAYPSIVMGRAGTSTALFQKIAALPVIPLIGKGEQVVNPVHIDDVVAAIVHIVSHWEAGKRTFYLTGSEVYTLRKLYDEQREWLRLPEARFLEVPKLLVKGALGMADKMGLAKLFPNIISSDTLDLLDSVGAPAPSYTPVMPRKLKDAFWLEPATLSDTWGARLRILHPLMLLALAFIWIFTGLTSAFFDLESGYELLAAGGITGAFATLGIYTGALLDFALGVAMLIRYRYRQVLWFQIVLMCSYMVLIGFIVPEQWLHPFGPVTKNFPMLAGTLLLIWMEPARTYLKKI